MQPLVRAGITERALTPATARTVVRPEPADGSTRLRGAASLAMARLFAAPRVA